MIISIALDVFRIKKKCITTLFFFKTDKSLAAEDILSNYLVHSEAECSLKCLEEQTCVAYNYRTTSAQGEINCQTSNTTLQKDADVFALGDWTFYQDLETLPVSTRLKRLAEATCFIAHCLFKEVVHLGSNNISCQNCEQFLFQKSDQFYVLGTFLL